MSFRILNPEPLGEPRGFNHGLLAPAGGRLLFVAGQTARGPDGRIAPGDLVAQFERALERVLRVVRDAGGGPEAIGRMTVYVTDLEAYRGSLLPLGRAWRRHMGRHYPAMTLVEVEGLMDEGALVEIEATAVLGAGGEPESSGREPDSPRREPEGSGVQPESPGREPDAPKRSPRAEDA